ncbi:hypothetical protein CTAYLR_009715 [Chrysophaeum taylorii]|uniref:Cyclic nucleotide-binding domain-containing protein n=1 Tax=Chrysophaeum taylorii TaxID=2483200 RepID=A0AAD7UGR0_9STRA|nr:hypothetical protein CTAYLR_009715 [Chrysophaeum taylorii]
MSPWAWSEKHGSASSGAYLSMSRERSRSRARSLRISPDMRKQIKRFEAACDDDVDLGYWNGWGLYARRHPHMLSPHGMYRIAWDSMMALLVMYIVISVPFQLGFSPSIPIELLVFEYILDFIFIMDVFVNLRTGYTNERGRLELDPKKSATHYLAEWFVVDAVSSLPPVIEIAMASISRYRRCCDVPPVARCRGGMAPHQSSTTVGTRFLRVMRCLRGVKLVRLVKLMYTGPHQSTMRDVLDDVMAAPTTRLIYKVLAMITFALLAAHLYACFFAASGTRAIKTYVEAIDGEAASNWSTWEEYVAYLYWAFSMMTTVGFGDIVAISNNERIYAIAAMFLGSAFYSYVIAIAASIVAGRDAKQATYFHRMEQLNAWMSHHHFPANLRRHIRRYFRMRFEKRTALDERVIMDELEPDLLEAVAEELLHETVKRNELFETLPRASLAKLVPIVTEILVGEGQTIVERGKRTSSFFILGHGEAELHDPLLESVTTLYPGNAFGELVLLGVRSTSQVVSTVQHLCDPLSMQAKAALRAIERLQKYHERKRIPVNPRTARSIAKLRALALQDLFTHDDHAQEQQTDEMVREDNSLARASCEVTAHVAIKSDDLKFTAITSSDSDFAQNAGEEDENLSEEVAGLALETIDTRSIDEDMPEIKAIRADTPTPRSLSRSMLRLTFLLLLLLRNNVEASLRRRSS